MTGRQVGQQAFKALVDGFEIQGGHGGVTRKSQNPGHVVAIGNFGKTRPGRGLFALLFSIELDRYATSTLQVETWGVQEKPVVLIL